LVRGIAFAMAMLFVGLSPAAAQKYPDRPIRIIVPFPAGGATDVVTRAIGERAGATLGQPWVIENRPGASGGIGLHACATAQPDGYTFCLLTADALTIMPHYNPDLYARYSSLVPVTQFVQAPAVIYASKDLPARDMKEFVALERAKPGSLNYASFGVGSPPQLFFEWLNKNQNVATQHVPFKGSNDALAEVMSGRVHASYVALGLIVQQINAGSLKGLAVLGDERAPLIPNVPSLGELGLDYPLKGTWFGLGAPQGTPAEVLNAIATAVRDAVHAADFKAKHLDPNGYVPVGSSPAEFAETVKAGSARGKEVIAVTGLRAQP
jgi:tripartite-type tricarboxylate transporter receptor subunit TctC